jgi:hypothetical protein
MVQMLNGQIFGGNSISEWVSEGLNAVRTNRDAPDN